MPNRDNRAVYARKLASGARDELRALARGDVRSVARRTWRYVRPVRGDYRRQMRMSVGSWISFYQRTIMLEQGCRWMGVQALKNPLDCWAYQEILYETRPEVVVEIGGYAGGSALYLAHLMDLLGGGTVVSVDRDRSVWEAQHERIVLVTGDSADADTIARVRELCQGRSVMVIQDADHRKEAVLRDLRAYADVVTPGCYFVVEDGIADVLRPGRGIGCLEPGPLAAVEEFLAENPDYEVDLEREQHLITWNARGFLRRTG